MPKSNFDVSSNFMSDIPQVNASLANPLTGSGLGCLKMAVSSGAWGTWYTAAIKTTVESGKYNAVPSTKKVSVRAKLRRTSHTVGAAPAQFAVGMFVKSPTSGLGVMAPLSSALDTRYAVWLGDYKEDGDPAPHTHGVYVGRRGNNTSLSGIGDTLVQAVAVNTWVGVRMDIIPTGGASDAILVYVDTTCTDTWGSPVYTTTVLNSDPTYVAWGGTGRIGFFQGGAYSVDPGRTDNADVGNPDFYIDDFVVIVEDA